MAKIPLTRGQETIVDDADLPLLLKWSWQASPSNVQGQFYARNSAVGFMHRLLTNCPEGMEVDHINRNPLDNRRNNLRVVTHVENMRNGKFALATHCPRGHAYDEQNTYRDNRGRRCKKCAAERQAGLRAQETPGQAESRKQYLREYFQKNKARMMAQSRAWVQRHRDGATA